MAEPILFVDHAAALGGAEHSLLLLLRHLDWQRWQPHLACSPGKLLESAAKEGIPTHVLGLPRLRRSPSFLLDSARGAFAIARVARRISASMIVANTVRAAFFGAPAARLARLPFVWHMRDFWLGESAPTWTVPDWLGKRLLAASAARIVANSHAVADHLPASARLKVIHNGIELQRFDGNSAGALFRERYAIPANAPVAGMVGRLRPWKGQKRFLLAAARVTAALPEAHFVIAGGDPFGVDHTYPQELHRLSGELGLAGRITFTGHLDDVRPALAAFDLFVHPGDPEPFGLVNVEAMAMRRPVVAFAHGALPEIVRPDTGILVHPGDVEALAGAVVALLTDPQRRREMGQAARQRAEEHFTIQRVAAEMQQVFAAAAGASRSRARKRERPR